MLYVISEQSQWLRRCLQTGSPSSFTNSSRLVQWALHVGKRRCSRASTQICPLQLVISISSLNNWSFSQCFQSDEVLFWFAVLSCVNWCVCVHRSVPGSLCSCCTAPSSSRWKRGPSTPSLERPATPWVKTSSSGSRSSTKLLYVTLQQPQQKVAQKFTDEQ